MKFLVDVNLPSKFSFFNSDDYIHVADYKNSLPESRFITAHDDSITIIH